MSGSGSVLGRRMLGIDGSGVRRDEVGRVGEGGDGSVVLIFSCEMGMSIWLEWTL